MFSNVNARKKYRKMVDHNYVSEFESFDELQEINESKKKENLKTVPCYRIMDNGLTLSVFM